jgi:hypothetical protein
VDSVAANAEMVEKLGLPFPLLSDPDAAVISAWNVYDPVGGTHGPIARPAIFVLGRDLTIPFDYVGRDFADRPPNSAIYAALDAVRGAEPRPFERSVTGRGPRPLDARNPADKPTPLADLAPYFRGAGFGVQALAGRIDDPAVRAEAERFRTVVGDYVKAAVVTWRLLHRSDRAGTDL